METFLVLKAREMVLEATDAVSYDAQDKPVKAPFNITSIKLQVLGL